MRVLPFQREDRDVAADTVCVVAGWGTVSHSGRRPDKLHEVERPVISRDLCNERTRHDHTITHKMMCTDSRRKDSCKVPLGHGAAAGPAGWGWKPPGCGGTPGAGGGRGLCPQGDGGSLPCPGCCRAALGSLES